MPIGLYICQCNGEISRIIDTARLAANMAKAKGVGVSREHACLCGADGLAAIKRDIEDGTVDRVVVAVCSPRTYQEEFARTLTEAGINRYLLERCNLREQCAWPHADNPDQAFRKAASLVAMSLARARLLEPLIPLTFPASNRVLVVGGGIAGLSAALDLSAAGAEVVVAEQQPHLGGRVVGFHRYFPRMCPPQCGVDYMVQKLRADSRVRLLTQTQLQAINGSPGSFEAELIQAPRYVAVERCTACGECAAVCPVSRDNPFDFGRSATRAAYLPHDMAYPRAYVIDRALCPEGCDLCSRACPTGAICLDQGEERFKLQVGSVVVATGWEPYDASRLERYGHGRFTNVVTNLEFERLVSPTGPTAGGLVRHSDGQPAKRVAFLQCAGSRDQEHLPYCSQICCTITLKQLAYVREADPDAEISVFYMDLRAVGAYERMYRDAQEKHGASFIRGNPYELVEDPRSKEITVRAEDTLSGRHVEVKVDLAVLATGMKPSPAPEQLISGLELEQEWGFASGHTQCFPMDLRRTGIYPAGCSQGPMDVSSAVRSAGAAAMKAVALARHPLEINPTVPVVDKTKCDKCKRCMEECPFDAWYWDETGYPAPDPLKCRQCGTCQGGCPMRVISIRNFSIKQVAGMIQALDPSFAGKGQPVILALLCANDAYAAADLAGQARRSYPVNVVSLPVLCAGSVNVAWVTDALTNGVDGVLIAGCKSDQCHFFHGSDLAKTRLGNMQDTLKRMMIEPDRIRVVDLSITDDAAYARLIEEFVASLQKLGPSPFKV